MAKDPLLRDAVRAIKAKIETAAAAAAATPEELAYLGTAIDRIGGRATVLEVEEVGDLKMAELTAHAEAVATVTMATVQAASQAAIDAAVLATHSATQQLVFGRKTFFFAQL